MERMYRGITGVVRRGVNSNHLKGQITMDKIRKLLPEGKQDAPDRTIRASLNRMARGNEIQKVHGQFFTKEVKKVEAADANKESEVLVMGRLLGTKTVDGKIVAEVEVSKLEY